MGELLLGIVLKTSIILSLALLFTVFAKRVSSAWRSLVGTSALVACCLVCLFPLLLPNEQAWTAPMVVSIAASSPSNLAVISPSTGPSVNPSLNPSEAAAAVAPESALSVDWEYVFFLFSVGLIIWILGSIWRAHCRISNLANVTDKRLLHDLQRAQEQIGSTMKVRFVWQDFSRSSFTFGWLRPLIAVPVGFAGWGEEKRRATLLHEIAHIQRRDFLVLTIARVIVALLWWHPLSWLTLRVLKQDIERACDDRVLSAGFQAKTYAQFLIDIASSNKKKLALDPVVQMAAPSALKRRISALIDNEQRRNSVSKTNLYTVMSVFLLAAVLLGSTVLVRAEPAPDRRYMPVYKTMPTYPREAQDAKLEGWVLLEFDVNGEGQTTNIKVVESSDQVFDQAAVDAVAKFHYLPERVDGKVTFVEGVRNKVTFALNDDSEGGDVAEDGLVQSVHLVGKQQFEVQRAIEAAAWQAELDEDGDRYLELARMAVEHHPSLASHLLLRAREHGASDKADLVLVTGMTFVKLGDLDAALTTFRQLAGQEGDKQELATRWHTYVEREVVRRKVVHQELVEGA